MTQAQPTTADSRARNSANKTKVKFMAIGNTPASGAAPQNGDDREELVRRTAYALYEARGRAHGRALDDWLQAQAQIAQSAATEAGLAG